MWAVGWVSAHRRTVAVAVVGLVTAGTAAALIGSASAARPSQFTVVGGKLTSAAGNPRPASGTQASLYGNGAYATTTLSGSGRVVLGAIADYCHGWPVVQVSVAGRILGDTGISGLKAYGTYPVGKPSTAASLPAGTHTVRIAMINDRFTSKCDRNVHLGYARMEFPAGPAGTPSSSPTAPVRPTISPSATVTLTPTATPSTGPLGLDASGTTIPDTAYAIPAGAVFLATNGSDSNGGSPTAPVRTLNKAVSLAPAGGTIVVRGGVYRDWYTGGGTGIKILSKPLTFQAYPHEKPWFDGSEVVPAGQWRSDGAGHWVKEWSTPDFCNGGYYSYRYNAQPTSNDGPCAHFDNANLNEANPAAADPQLAFVDGRQLREVTGLAQVGAATFFYAQDLANRTGKLYLGTNPAGHTVELAKRPQALILGGSNFAIKGLGFRRYATSEQDGLGTPAVYVGASDTLVENSVFTENAAGGLYLKPKGGVVRHSVFARNGFTAMGSNGTSNKGGTDNLLVESSVFSGNNAELFGDHCSRSCGTAGFKSAHLGGFTIRGNIFENNRGKSSGFWCDTDCTGGVIVNNIARGNHDGIFYEVSSNGIIASNLVYGNAFTGLRVAAANMKIYNNTVVDNKTLDMWIFDDSRRGTSVAPDAKNIDVKNNILSGGNVNTLKLEGRGGAPNTTPNTFVTGLDYNSYYRSGGPGKVLVAWAAGATTTYYKSLADLRAARGWENHGQDIATGGDPFFVNSGAANFRLRSGSPALGSGTALPADVAKSVGVATSAGLNRGAITWPGK